jgi:hypothetical protein
LYFSEGSGIVEQRQFYLLWMLVRSCTPFRLK